MLHNVTAAAAAAVADSVVHKIRRAVMKEFGLEELYFSAPTFMARLIGNDSWTPAEIHDEYWYVSFWTLLDVGPFT